MAGIRSKKVSGVDESETKEGEADITLAIRKDMFSKEDVKEFEGIMAEMQQKLTEAGYPLTVAVKDLKKGKR